MWFPLRSLKATKAYSEADFRCQGSQGVACCRKAFAEQQDNWMTNLQTLQEKDMLREPKYSQSGTTHFSQSSCKTKGQTPFSCSDSGSISTFAVAVEVATRNKLFKCTVLCWRFYLHPKEMFQLACPGITNRMTSPLINQPLFWAFLVCPKIQSTAISHLCKQELPPTFSLAFCSHFLLTHMLCSFVAEPTQESIHEENDHIAWSPYLPCSSSSCLIECWPTPVLTKTEIQRIKKQIFPILLQRAGLHLAPKQPFRKEGHTHTEHAQQEFQIKRDKREFGGWQLYLSSQGCWDWLGR